MNLCFLSHKKSKNNIQDLVIAVSVVIHLQIDILAHDIINYYIIAA